MKRFNSIVVIFLVVVIGLSSCRNKKKEENYVKKVQLSEETIAVGIYKPTGVETKNVQYIAEAINIDAGIVYVTLTDTEILKTRLENIDVVIFPDIKNGERFIAIDDEIEKIFNDFIIKKGKGALGFCNGAAMLVNSEENSSLELIDVSLVEKDEKKNGLLQFELTEQGQELFPELMDYDNVYVNYNSDVVFNMSKESKSSSEVMGYRIVNGINQPIFIGSKCGKGKLFLSAAHPETTPGMRWMIPRMVRWLYGKESVWYDHNVVRPDLYKTQLIFNDEVLTKIDNLKNRIAEGENDDKIEAMQEMQDLYPWFAAEEVKALLLQKNDDLKLKAAKYMVDVEYTYALDNVNEAIQNERSRKVKEQLNEYAKALEMMIDQN